MHVIQPDDGVDSYEILKCSDIVTTYISTIAMEALFLYKPVICLGKGFYHECKEIMQPTNDDELRDCLLNPKKPMNRTFALNYGNYQTEHGMSHLIYKPESMDRGSIDGYTLSDIFQGKFK